MGEDDEKIELDRETIEELGEPRTANTPLSTLEALCGKPVVPNPIYTGTVVTEGDCHPHVREFEPLGDPVEDVEAVEIREEP